MKRTILPLLLVCLLLSACGEKGESAPPESLSPASDAQTAADTAVAEVDGRTVTAGQYRYWLGVVCDEIQSYYSAAGLALNWSAPLAEGTLGDYAKTRALRSAALYATVENWAERHGCGLTEEERAAMDAAWVLEMACCGGAMAMGLEDCRELEVGMQADLAVIDLHQPNMQPVHNTVKNIVYSGSKSNVALTMVAGRVLFERGEFHLDESAEDIYAHARQAAGRLVGA